MKRHPYRIAALVSLAWAFAGFVGGSYGTAAQSAQPVTDITFTKNIAPVLQRSCQRCHRPDGGAPMALITYEQVRPWARSIKTRTGMGPRAGVMPPWFVEKNIGIQGFKHDPSLSDAEIAMIAKWVDSRSAARQSCRHAEGARFRQRRQVAARRTGSHRAIRRRHRPSGRSGQVGLARHGPDRTHGGSLRLVRRSARDQRHSRWRLDDDGGWALCVPPHDLRKRRARWRGGWRR